MHGSPPRGHAIDEGSTIVEFEMYAFGGFYGVGWEGVGHGCVGVEDVVAVYVEEGGAGVGAGCGGGALADVLG